MAVISFSSFLSGQLIAAAFGSSGKIPSGDYLLSSVEIENFDSICPGRDVRLFQGIVDSFDSDNVEFCGVSIIGKPCPISFDLGSQKLSGSPCENEV